MFFLLLCLCGSFNTWEFYLFRQSTGHGHISVSCDTSVQGSGCYILHPQKICVEGIDIFPFFGSAWGFWITKLLFQSSSEDKIYKTVWRKKCSYFSERNFEICLLHYRCNLVSSFVCVFSWTPFMHLWGSL